MKIEVQLDYDRGWYRQGDVDFIPVVETPELRKKLANATRRLDGTVAYGEVTGHSHRVDCGGGAAAVLELEEGLFTEVYAPQGAKVLHEDHDPAGAGFATKTGELVNLPPGLFITRQPRELTVDQVPLQIRD